LALLLYIALATTASTTYHQPNHFIQSFAMVFSDELWDGFEAVACKSSDGKKFVDDVLNFMKKRRELELEYSKKLSALVKSLKVPDTGTLDSAWNVVKNETDAIASAHLAFAERLGSEVEQAPKSWLAETAKTRKELKMNGKKLLNHLQAAQAAVEKSKIKYETSRKKQDSLQSEANADPNPKNQKKLQAEVKSAEKADDEYKKLVEKLKTIESRFYDSEMPQILSELQTMEEGRLSMMKTTLSAYVAAQAALCPAIKNACDTMEASTSKINPDNDIRLFIASAKTGKIPPARTEYEPYDSALGSCKRSASSSPSATVAPSPSSAAFSASSATFSASSATFSASSASFSALSPVAPSPLTKSAPLPLSHVSSSVRVKAQYTYKSTEPNELSFTEGSIINVTYQDESGWWEGELNGQVGVFPSNHVVVIDNGAAAASSLATSTPIQEPAVEEAYGECRALYSYNAEEEGELSIAAGEVLSVEEQDDEGWYYGRNQNGDYGKYPSNYVELLQ